jgi:hypothetical protein
MVKKIECNKKPGNGPGAGRFVSKWNQESIEHDSTKPGDPGQQMQQHVSFMNMCPIYSLTSNKASFI